MTRTQIVHEIGMLLSEHTHLEGTSHRLILNNKKLLIRHGREHNSEDILILKLSSLDLQAGLRGSDWEHAIAKIGFILEGISQCQTHFEL